MGNNVSAYSTIFQHDELIIRWQKRYHSVEKWCACIQCAIVLDLCSFQHSCLLLGYTSSSIPTCLLPFHHRFLGLCSYFIGRCVLAECIDELTKWVHQVEEDADCQLPCTMEMNVRERGRLTCDPLGNLLLVSHRVVWKSRLCRIYKLSLHFHNLQSIQPS